MFRNRNRVSALLLAILGLTSACSTHQTPPLQAQQSESIARWNRCIERFSDQYSGSATALGRRANAFCEGHRRDVVATFPPHLENRVDTLLSQRATAISTARFVRTTGDTAWDASKGAQLDTLRTRLMETRRADL